MADAEKILADRLALALMSLPAHMQTMLTSPEFAQLRNEMRTDDGTAVGYALCRRLVTRMVNAEKQRLQSQARHEATG